MDGASQTMKKFIVLLGVLGVSCSAILVKSADAPSMVLVLYRMLLAAVCMTVPCLTQLRREKQLWGKREVLCCLVSGFFLALHFTAYFESLRHTSIASALVLVDTEVFFVAFLMLVFLGQRIPAKGWLGILLAFGGSIVVALGDAGGGSSILQGDFIALLGAACMSVYTIMGTVCRRRMSTTVYTTAVYWVAALTTAGILTLRQVPLLGYGAKNLACGFGMAIFCTLLGHSVFSWGLKYLPASYISTVKLMEPIFASLLGMVFFLQIPSLTAVVGGGAILGGLICYSRVTK